MRHALFHVQWLKLILGVLIPFGIYRYREILVESFYYAIQLNLSILLTFLFILLSVIVGTFRLKYLIKKQGGLINFWTVFKCYFISLSPVFSMIRFSDSIKIYYLKKKGIILSQAMTAYVGEIVISLFVTGIMFALFLGQYNIFLFIALCILLLLTFLFVKFSHKIPNIKFLNILKDFSENLKSLLNVRSIFFLLIISFIQFFSSAAALSVATGSSFVNGLKALIMGIGIMTTTPTIAGIGFYEVAVPAYLISLGVNQTAAVGGVFVFRFFNLWLPAIIGNFLIHKEL